MDGLISSNPVTPVRLPKQEKPAPIGKFLTAEEANAVLEVFRFHDLRRSTASILYDQGWEMKDIREWLGHAELSTTANIYTHISKLRREEMAKTFEKTFHL